MTVFHIVYQAVHVRGFADAGILRPKGDDDQLAAPVPPSITVPPPRPAVPWLPAVPMPPLALPAPLAPDPPPALGLAPPELPPATADF